MFMVLVIGVRMGMMMNEIFMKLMKKLSIRMISIVRMMKFYLLLGSRCSYFFSR